MEKCGNYAAGRTIGWGRRATYYAGAAEGAGTGAASEIVIGCSRTSDRAQVQAFLRSSAEQQTAHDSGCKRIAAVLGFGLSEKGRAYQVTAGYESSLAECIEAHNKLDGDSLKTIVTGTLRALTEMREKCRRAHGNLTAGNILLDPAGEVYLTDLAPLASKASHAEDLHALGTILYQTIRKSLHVGFLAPPLDHSPEWTEALGDEADDWRELTNRLLLAKKQDDHEVLARATKDLKALGSLGEKAAPLPSSVSHGPPGQASTIQRPAPRRKKNRSLVTALAVLVLAGGGFGVWKFTRPEPPPPPPPPKPTLSIDTLKNVIPATAGATLGEGKYILDYLKASSSPSEMANHLRGWVTTEKLGKVESDWRGRGGPWLKLAELLETKATLEGTFDELDETQQGERIGEALKDLGRAGALLTQAQILDSRWNRVKQAAKRVAEVDTTVLPNFGKWVDDEVGNSPSLEVAVQRATAAETALNELAETGARLKPRVRFEAFKKAAAGIPATSENPPWPKLWQTKMEASLRPTDEVLAQWNGAFTRIEARIAARPPSDRKQYQDELATIRGNAGTALDGDATGITDSLTKLQMKIRDPLADLDAAYRKLLGDFSASLDAAQTTAAGTAEFTRFRDKSKALLAGPEFADSARALLANYRMTSLDGFYGRLDLASRAPGKPVYTFPNAVGRWVAGPEGPKSATFTFTRGALQSRMTFHLLNESTAMASAETSLALARMTGVPLDPPGLGPLNARDSGRPVRDRWLWPTADKWAKAVAGQRLGNPDAILARDADPELCPVTWINLARATQIATALGGRLPNRADWDAALRLFPPAAAKLQGATYAAAEQQIRDLFAAKSFDRWPIGLNGFPYPPAGGGGNYTGNVDDQRLLWLAPANNNQGKVGDLIGNAAEWISDGGAAFVAGGSCVTSASSAVMRPLPTNAAAAYFDVTFRLVIAVTPGSENAGLDALRAEAKKEVETLAGIPVIGG